MQSSLPRSLVILAAALLVLTSVGAGAAVIAAGPEAAPRAQAEAAPAADAQRRTRLRQPVLAAYRRHPHRNEAHPVGGNTVSLFQGGTPCNLM
jgi:hypothetical protein